MRFFATIVAFFIAGVVAVPAPDAAPNAAPVPAPVPAPVAAPVPVSESSLSTEQKEATKELFSRIEAGCDVVGTVKP